MPVPRKENSTPQEKLDNKAQDASLELSKIAADAKNLPATELAPNLKKDLVTNKETLDFINALSITHGLSKNRAFAAFALLSLKGACNEKAPPEMAVDILDEDGKNVNLTKYDLQYACYQVTKNRHLRRFAQALAIPICEYAEANGLAGDLSNKLNILAMAKENGTPLNFKERAWACSFCQNVNNLQEYAGDRVPALLAEDYQKRFARKAQVKNAKQGSSKQQDFSPRKIRQPKPTSKDKDKGKDGTKGKKETEK